MAIIKKTNLCWQERGGHVTGATTMEIGMLTPQNKKNRLTL
jgi:hypothetical protein